MTSRSLSFPRNHSWMGLAAIGSLQGVIVLAAVACGVRATVLFLQPAAFESRLGVLWERDRISDSANPFPNDPIRRSDPIVTQSEPITPAVASADQTPRTDEAFPSLDSNPWPTNGGEDHFDRPLSEEGDGRLDDVTWHPLALAVQADRLAPWLGSVGEDEIGQPWHRWTAKLPDNFDEQAYIAAAQAIYDAKREQQDAAVPGQATFYGQTLKGRRFAFVLDRSNSMGPGDTNAFPRSREETFAAVAELTAEQRATVIVYNTKPDYVLGDETIPVTASMRELLTRRLNQTLTEGGTLHVTALLAALRTRADVIVMVTDGGDPVPNAGALDLIRKKAVGRQLHFVRVSNRPLADHDTWLSDLARETGGTFRSVELR